MSKLSHYTENTVDTLKTFAVVLIAAGWPVAILAGWFRLPDAFVWAGGALGVVGIILYGAVTEEVSKARKAGSSPSQDASEQPPR